ncbi:MAG: repeat protein [Fibrobacteres bacterium]|nr:repeat protein [Fibrobacterota bacterium]
MKKEAIRYRRAAGAVLLLAMAVQAQLAFKKIHVNGAGAASTSFVGEGPSAADFNKDGNLDVATGSFWYEGPNFTVKHKFCACSDSFPVTSTYSTNYLALKSQDLNKDGWPDLIYTHGAGYSPVTYYENPKGGTGNWNKVDIMTQVVHETATMADVFKDGKYELVHLSKVSNVLRMGYSSPSDEADLTKPWTFHPISDPAFTWGYEFLHGLGIADVNGDGRNDILVQDCWYEQPASVAGYPLWIRHAFDFSQRKSQGGSQMYTSDLDGDGDSDVVASLAGHGWGLDWFEQIKAADGSITFTPHIIMSDRAGAATYGVAFSQLHSLGFADLDGDGLKDIITGKRWWAHNNPNPADPENSGTPMLYWFKQVRSGGVTSFKPFLIDSTAGSGVNIEIVDMNGDGTIDIVSSSKAGTNVFLTPKSNSALGRISPMSARPLILDVQPDAGRLILAMRSLGAHPEAPAPGTVLVFDDRGKVVARLPVERRLGLAPDRAVWNGRNLFGMPVANGAYFFAY